MSLGKAIQVSFDTSVMTGSTRAGRGFCVDGGEMRLRQHLAHHLGGGAGVDEVVDDQDARALIELFKTFKPLLLIVVVGDEADRLDHPDVELALQAPPCRRTLSRAVSIAGSSINVNAPFVVSGNTLTPPQNNQADEASALSPFMRNDSQVPLNGANVCLGRNLQNRTGFALRFVFVLHPIPF